MRREVRGRGYDRIIDIHDSLRSRYLSANAGPVVRVNKRKLARLLLVKTKLNVYGRLGGAPGVAERYLETVEDLDIRDDGKGLEVFPGPDHAERAAAALAGVSGAVIALAPGARHWNKMWPQERFVEASVQLVRRLRASVLLFGSAADLERSGWIEQRIRAAAAGAVVVNLSGRLSLLETAAAMDRASVVVTNDSGLMHLAAARKRPVVALFGPTVRELGFFPVGTRAEVLEVEDLRCRPCTHIGLSFCPKDHFRCMLDIPASRVVESATRLCAE